MFLLIVSIVAYSCNQAVVKVTESVVIETPSPIQLDLSFLRTIDLTKENVYSVDVYDFNNDGYDDIVLGVYGGYSKIFINNQDETFTSKDLTEKKYFTEIIRAIEIDNDGNKDLLIGNNQQDILFLKGNGDGTFGLLKEFDKTSVKDIVVADFDNNGYEDFVIGTQSKKNFVYFNNYGEFTRIEYSEALSITAVDAADFNNDGFTDIVVGISRKPTRIYMNDGNKIFTLTEEIGNVPNTESLSITDLDGDGRSDILQGNNKDANFLIFNKEDGFEKGQLPDIGNTYAVISADLDNDKIDELIIGDYEEAIRIYKRYNEDYELVKAIQEPFKNYVKELAVGDFNNDGKLDLVVARQQELTQIYIS